MRPSIAGLVLGAACASATAFSCAGGGGRKQGGGSGPLVIGGGGSAVRVTRITVAGGMATRAEAAWNGRGYGVFYNLGTTGDLYFVATDTPDVPPRRVLGGWISGAAYSGEGWAVSHNGGVVLLEPDGDSKTTVELPKIDNAIGAGPVRWNRDAGEWVTPVYGYDDDGGAGVQREARPVWWIARIAPSGQVTEVIDAGRSCDDDNVCARSVPVWTGETYAVAYGGSRTPPTIVELGGSDRSPGVIAGHDPIANIALAHDGAGYALAFRRYLGLAGDEIVFTRLRDGRFSDRATLSQAAADRFVHSPVVYTTGDLTVVVWQEGPPGVFDGRLYYAVINRDGRVVSARRRLDASEQPQEWPHFVDAPQPAVIYIVGPQEGPGEIRVAAISPQPETLLVR